MARYAGKMIAVDELSILSSEFVVEGISAVVSGVRDAVWASADMGEPRGAVLGSA